MKFNRSWVCILLTSGLALLALLALALWVTSHPAQAGTLTVCASGCGYATIQAAVDAAGDGDTILVADETFAETIVITRSVRLMGGYTGLPGDTTSRTPRATIVDGGATGSAIYIGGVGVTAIEVTVDGFEVTHGNAGAGNGGGIYVDVEDDSVITLNDNFIHDNTATDGGGIYADVDNRSDLHITGNDIMTNTTIDDYAGLYADVYLSGTLVLSDNNIVGNISGDRYGGGTVYVEGLTQFEIENNLIMSNTTAIDGDPLAPYRYYGGLYFQARYNSHGTFDRNRVIGNTADDYYGGGYVYMYYNSSTTFYDNEFRGNTTNYRGYGGLYLYAYGNSHITGESLVLASNVVNGATYDYGGGYIYAIYNSTITLSNTQVTGNRVADDYAGAYFYAYDHSTINVPDLYVYDNVAGGDCGGVYLDASDGNDTVIATEARIISNTAGNSGGGAYAYASDGSMVDLTGSQFMSNTAGTNGGGLYVSSIYGVSSMMLSQTEFLTNTAGSNGGGVYFSTGPTYGSHLDLSYARFISNTAQTGDGGGAYMSSVYYNMPMSVSVQADHMEFVRNRSGDQGGGFYLYDAYDGPGQLVFDDGVYQNNIAGSDGGGLYWYDCTEGCTMSMQRNLFEANEATTGDGGGVYFYEARYGSEIHVDNNQFLNNAAGDEGGGFYNYYFAYEGVFGTFDRNVLRGNTAGGDGGGFYSDSFGYDGAEASFLANVVVDNVSGGDGGGVYIDYPAYYATSAFNRNVITGNIAIDGYGGGVYMEYFEYGARAEFKDNIISHNVISSTGSYSGGGLYLYSIDEGSIVWMTGNEFNDNIATEYGGGLYMDDYVDYGSVWIFEDNELQRNWTSDGGGGCYFDDYWYDGAVVYFNRNLINDNTALGDYGGCYFYNIEYAEVDFIGNQFNRNTAGGDYGGIYFESVYDGAVMRFWDNQIISNRAGITETRYLSASVVYTDPVVMGGDYGGLFLEDIQHGGDVDFRRNQILSNTAYLTGTTGGSYAGMYADLDNNGLLTMVDNVIAGNKAQDSAAGLFAEIYSGSRLVMEHNLIHANTAITDSAGIYIKGNADSQYFLRRNQVYSNTAGRRSAGVIIDNDDLTNPLWGWSVNNLIAENTEGSQMQAGIFVDETDFRSLNDTIVDNAGIGIYISGTLTNTAYVSNTILWGHTESFSSVYPITQTLEADYSDIQLSSGIWPGVANLNAVPLFVGSGDYHLQSTSPVLSQANAAVAPARDLDNVPRPVGAGVDMGCYEFHLAGVTVTSDGLLTGDPGTWAMHTVTITNDGDAEDVFALALSGNVWTATLSVDSATLAAGANTTVDIAVRIPADAGAGDSDTVTIDAVSTRNALVVASDSVDTEANLVPDVAVYPDHSAVANVGSTQIYHHVVENMGNGTETFDLSVVSSQGWTVHVLPTGVTLGEGLTATVEVRVVVPVEAGGLVDVTTLTATASSDSSVADSATDMTTAVNNADIGVTVTEASDTAGIGDTHVYSFTVTNNASVTDTFNLTYTSSAGWVSGFEPDSVTLGPGESATVYITVTTPSAGTDGDTDTTVVDITSGNDPSVQESVSLVTILDVTTAVALTPDRSATLGVNETQVYTHTLTNNGDQPDTIGVAASSSQGWLVDWNPKSVSLGAGASATIYVTVTTPATGNDGETDLTRVTATSGNDAAVKDSASAVTVLDVPPPLPPDVDIALTPNRAATALVGSTQTYTHTLTNNGSAADTLTMSVMSSEGWAVSVSPTSVNLGVGASATIMVTVTVPDSGANGLVDITLVQAASANAGDAVAATAADVTTLLNPASVALTMDQAKTVIQGETAVYTHTLTNNGVRVDTFALSASSDRGWTTQLDATAMTLDPGASAEIVLQVQVPADVVPDTVDTTTLTATSAYGAAAFASNVDTTTVKLAISQLYLPLVQRNYSVP